MEKIGHYHLRGNQHLDQSQTFWLMVTELYVVAKRFYLKSKNISGIAAIQACYINSDVTYSLGKKWTWNLWCSKERSGEEFVSRYGEDGNILETEAGIGVLMCTWLEAPQTPSPRDYPNLVMTSLIRWAKSYGSNSYRVRELSQRWKPDHSKETYRAPSPIYPQWVEWRE